MKRFRHTFMVPVTIESDQENFSDIGNVILQQHAVAAASDPDTVSHHVSTETVDASIFSVEVIEHHRFECEVLYEVIASSQEAAMHKMSIEGENSVDVNKKEIQPTLLPSTLINRIIASIKIVN